MLVIKEMARVDFSYFNYNFASAISIQQYNEANFVSELNYPMFISAIYGLSLAWFPFPIAYVVLRFLLDDLQHEYPKQ